MLNRLARRQRRDPKWPRPGSAQRNISFAVAEQATRMVLGFAVSTKVARELGPTQFGDLALGLALATLLLPFATAGTDAVLLQELASGEASDSRWSRPSMRIRSIGTAAALLAGTGVVLLLADGGRSTATALLALSILITVPVDIAFLRAIARHQLGRIAPWRIVILVFGAGARLAVLALGGNSTAIAAVLLGETMLVALVTARLMHGPKPQPTGGDTTRVLQRSFPYLISGLLYAIYLRIDMLLVRTVLGAADLGTYSVAVRVSELGAASTSLVVPSLAAAIAQVHRTGSPDFYDAYAALFRRSIMYGFGVGLATASAGWLFLEPVFGSQYVGARNVVAIHAFSIVPLWFLAVRERYIVAIGRGSMQITPSVVGALVAVIVNLLLLPTIGVVGAAWSTLLSYSAAAVWSLASRRQRELFAPLSVVNR